MDERQHLFETWAPSASPWAAWAKPVLFAHRPPAAGADFGEATSPGAIPASDGATAVVVDLPGPAGVTAAVPLARLGYRPVPVYNAVPAGAGVPAAVDVGAILSALAATAADLRAVRLAADAPPAFLLDAGRRVARAGVTLGPGVFDNRSVSLPTDFPSAGRLRAAGVRRIVLVQPTTAPPASDLAHTLRRWQDGGLPILRYAADAPDRPPVLVAVARPGGFRSMWHGLTARLGLRRHPLGGFGGTLPFPSSG